MLNMDLSSVTAVLRRTTVVRYESAWFFERALLIFSENALE
jgi:hypothetical protein